MKLSEAIKLGAPHAIHDRALTIRVDKDCVRACPLGTAAIGLSGDMAVDGNLDWAIDVLQANNINLEHTTTCPVCNKEWSEYSDLIGLVIHLTDSERFTREQTIEYLEGIGE